MKQLLILLSCLTIPSRLYPQEPEWLNYTTSNSGLPNRFVRCIVIDGSGNKWIGTNAGLGKFDGATWTDYYSSNSGLPDSYVYGIAIDGAGNKWIGTQSGGLARFDGATWSVYNTSNSSLPYDAVNSISIDSHGNKWIGTYGGLAKFDGSTWTVYTSSNSGLPANNVLSISIDGDGNKWIGTYDGGLAKFDDLTWTVFTASNSGLPSNYILSVVVDSSGNKWIGTYYGLAKYDNTTWTVYTTSNSGLPDDFVYSMAGDGSGNLWIGTHNGLAKYNGSAWTTYSTSNSGLPGDIVYPIALDAHGNKWIGTYGAGVAIFNQGGILSAELTSFFGIVIGGEVSLSWKTVAEVDNYGFEIERRRIKNPECRIQGVNGGWTKIGFVAGAGTSDEQRGYSFVDNNVVAGRHAYRLKQIDKDGSFKYSQSVEVEISVPASFVLEQNYPNPFNPATIIGYGLSADGHVSLKVLDVLGQEVATLVNEQKSAGAYTATWNAAQHPSGVYFYRLAIGNYTLTRKLLLMR